MKQPIEFGFILVIKIHIAHHNKTPKQLWAYEFVDLKTLTGKFEINFSQFLKFLYLFETL